MRCCELWKHKCWWCVAPCLSFSALCSIHFEPSCFPFRTRFEIEKMGVRSKRVTLTSVDVLLSMHQHLLRLLHPVNPVPHSHWSFNTSCTITFSYRKPATNAFSVRGHPVSEFSPKENQKRVHEKGGSTCKYKVKLNYLRVVPHT